MPARPLMPGKFDPWVAARAAKLGRPINRTGNRNKGSPVGTTPEQQAAIEAAQRGVPANTIIPNDPDSRRAMTRAGEAVANRPKVVDKMVALALSRAEVKDRILGPAPVVAAEEAKAYGHRKLAQLVPKALRVLEFNLDHGQVREQLVAAQDTLDRAGFYKGPAIPLGNGPVIVINMPGALPWEPKVIDVTPKPGGE